MIKPYSEWLNEEIKISRSKESPIKIELITGNVVSSIDIQEENWQAQTIHLKDYQELLKDVKEALKEDDAKKISTAISKATELPLFSQEPSKVWVRSQIEKQQPMRSNVDFNRWVARYIENKLGSFISWAENKK